jgi:dihydrofolate reductase
MTKNSTPLPWLSMVVATSLNNCIGKADTLPWRISEDLKNFKAITENKTIVMGRKTWDSLPKRPLPNRRNVVLSSSLQSGDCLVVHNMKELLNVINDEEAQKGCCVIGGATLYRACLPYVSRLLITRVHTKIEGDTYLPEIDWLKWKMQSVKKISIAPLESWLTEYKRKCLTDKYT